MLLHLRPYFSLDSLSIEDRIIGRIPRNFLGNGLSVQLDHCPLSINIGQYSLMGSTKKRTLSWTVIHMWRKFIFSEMEDFHLQEEVLMNYLGDFQRRRRRDFFDLVDREFIETTRFTKERVEYKTHIFTMINMKARFRKILDSRQLARFLKQMWVLPKSVQLKGNTTIAQTVCGTHHST